MNDIKTSDICGTPNLTAHPSKALDNVQLGAVQGKKFKKSENTMEVGGWVQVSLGIFFLENHPKIATSTDILE